MRMLISCVQNRCASSDVTSSILNCVWCWVVLLSGLVTRLRVKRAGGFIGVYVIEDSPDPICCLVSAIVVFICEPLVSLVYIPACVIFSGSAYAL